MSLFSLSKMDCTNLHPSQCGGEVPDLVGLGRNSCWSVRGFQISKALFQATGALDTKWKTLVYATSIHNNGNTVLSRINKFALKE